MIYRIGFWIGPVPADTEAACADLHTRAFVADEIWRELDQLPPPVPRIRRFVEAVLTRFPEDFSDDSSPWKYSDIEECAMADTFMPVLRGPNRNAIAILTQLADEHGICGFDMAAHSLLDVADVSYLEGELWTAARLGGGLDVPDVLRCRGPEIARERLGLPSPTRDDDEDGLDAFTV